MVFKKRYMVPVQTDVRPNTLVISIIMETLLIFIGFKSFQTMDM